MAGEEFELQIASIPGMGQAPLRIPANLWPIPGMLARATCNRPDVAAALCDFAHN